MQWCGRACMVGMRVRAYTHLRHGALTFPRLFVFPRAFSTYNFFLWRFVGRDSLRFGGLPS